MENKKSVFQILVIAILLSSVFFFGATLPVVLSAVEGAIIITFLVWYVTTQNEKLQLTPLFKPLFALIIIMVIQIIPLPVFLVKLISPNTVYLKEKLGFSSNWVCISLVPALTLRELVRWISITLLFILVVNLFNERRALVKLLRSIMALSVFEALYGLFLFFTKSPSLLWYVKPEYCVKRVHGTFRNPDHFAGYMEMAIPLHLSEVLSWREEGPYKMEEKAKKFLGIFVISILALSLFFSLSRAGIFSFILALAFWFFLYRKEKTTRRDRLKFYFQLFLIVLSAYLFWIGVIPILDRFFMIEDNIKGGRLPVWLDTLNVIKHYPFLGTGWGTYRFTLPVYKERTYQLIYSHAHNDYLEILAEGGIVSFLIFVWLIFEILKTGVKSGSLISRGALTGIFAMLIHFFFDFNLHIPGNAYVFFTLAAIVYIDSALIKTRSYRFDKR